MRYLTKFVLVVLCLSGNVFAQSESAHQAGSIEYPHSLNCTSTPTKAEIKDEMQWRTSPNEFWDDPQYTNGQEATFTRRLDVKFIIVQKDDGSGNVNAATIDSWIQEFNQKIVGSKQGNTYKVKIRRCGNIKRLKSTRFYNLGPNEETPLRNTFFKPNLINIYIVNKITLANGSVAGGYTHFPAAQTNGENAVFLDKDYGAPILIHELGHVLGLYHTHETAFGIENVARSGARKNCTTAGDGFCDTPGDPNLSNAVLFNTCQYIRNYVDPFGETYIPVTNNYMSYTPPSCMTKFTNRQDIKAFEIATRYKAQGNGCTVARTADPNTGTATSAAARLQSELDDFDLVLAPNPVRDHFRLMANYDQIDSQESITLSIMDMTGRLIQTQGLGNVGSFNEADIPVSKLSPGMYMAVITTGNIRKSIRFVKQ